MAEIWPNEGLDAVLAIFPKNGANVASTYIGLFTAYSASTTGTGGQTMTSYTEPSGGAYARQSIAAASWGAQANGSGAAGTPGRKVTAGQVTFPTATAAWGTLNGFFVASSSVAAAGVCYFAANFDDVTATPINTNDILKLTPTAEYGN